MKIKTLAIQNFKAFGFEQRFELGGKNILIYGNNGAGKSSVYYALHAFMQSSSPGKQWQKYFDPSHIERLLNTYTDPAQARAFVRLTTENDQIYELSGATAADALPSTHADISLANLASDFMNYRLLFNFYNFRNSSDADIWDVFEKEIFPYWTYDPITNTSFEQQLANIRKRLYDLSQMTERNSGTSRINHIGTKQPDYKTLQRDLLEFNQRFADTFRVLQPDVQTLLSTYFLPSEDVSVHIEPQGSLSIRPKNKYELDLPVLRLTLTINGHDIARPQTFLNEARLTALALSIRLAMVGQKFKGIAGRDDLRLLVLDDLLISLDMSNRMKVIRYLQTNPDFSNYQLIILTHDKGFFEILKANLNGNNSTDWKYFEMFEQLKPLDSQGYYINPICLDSITSFKKAECYLNGTSPAQGIPAYPKDYESCALYLRKHTEEILRVFFDPSLEELPRYTVFEKLVKILSSVKKEINQQLERDFEKIFHNDTITTERLERFVAYNLPASGIIDIETNQLNRYKATVFRYITNYYERQRTIVESIINRSAKLNEIRGRILNIGAHAGEESLFRNELDDVITEIKEFEEKLSKIEY